jgi:hypothetical protein
VSASSADVSASIKSAMFATFLYVSSSSPTVDEASAIFLPSAELAHHMARQPRSSSCSYGFIIHRRSFFSERSSPRFTRTNLARTWLLPTMRLLCRGMHRHEPASGLAADRSKFKRALAAAGRMRRKLRQSRSGLTAGEKDEGRGEFDRLGGASEECTLKLFHAARQERELRPMAGKFAGHCQPKTSGPTGDYYNFISQRIVR